MNKKLSNHFTIDEFLHSNTAIRLGRPLQLKPEAAQYQNLKRLAEEILDPLREELGVPLRISSGFRPPWLNKIVGGSASSQHQQGLAADVVATNSSALKLCQKAVEMGLPFDQLIHEFGRWMHISVAPVGRPPRGQVLTAKKLKGKTVYLQGLHPA